MKEQQLTRAAICFVVALAGCASPSVSTPNPERGDDLNVYSHRCGAIQGSTPTRNLASWMGDNAKALGPKRIRDILIPGTHDSATFCISSTSAISVDRGAVGRFFERLWPGQTARWSRAQSRNIGNQLTDGIRYLDLRVCRNPEDKEPWICHGMLSVTVDQVLSEVVKFLEGRQKEIVILDFNHFFEMDAEAHAALGRAIHDALGSRMIPRPRSSDEFERITMNSLWDQDKQVIVLYGGVEGDTRGQDAALKMAPGLFWPQKWISSPWPDKQDSGALGNTLQKNPACKPAPWDKLYVSQVVLTPSAWTILRGMVNPAAPQSLLDLARDVAPRVADWARNWPRERMNIVIVDHYDLCAFASTIVEMNFSENSEHREHRNED